MTNKRRIIGIAVAAMLALIGTAALVGYVNSARDDAVADEELVDVYVVDQRVPQGADPDTIVSSVSVEQVPARLRQPGAITDLEDVGDRVAAAELQPGDQLVAARLASKELVLAEVTDKVQVAAKLDAERAVGGVLAKGDLVGVYMSFDPFQTDEAGQAAPAGDDGVPIEAARGVDGVEAVDAATADDAPEGPTRTPNVSRLEFRNVLVTNVQTINASSSSDDENDDDGVEDVASTQYVVTLALSPEQSERFVFATEFGHVWLSLDPATVDDDGTRPITLGNVFQVVR